MRITEHLLDPDRSGPWANIAKQVARKYKQTTGRSFDGELLTQAALHDRRPPEVADSVGWGFARKAVRQMRATCGVCGAQARRRRVEYRDVFLCASCHLPSAFTNQLHRLLRAQDAPSGMASSVLMQHQLPPLVRQSIPPYMWRSLVLPDGSTFQYITDRDLEGMKTWLLRLGLILERVSGERAHARLQAASVKMSQDVEEEEPA